ncbi:adhesin [Pantoea vagans]|nr:adhesin [Pantoea vagans]
MIMNQSGHRVVPKATLLASAFALFFFQPSQTVAADALAQINIHLSATVVAVGCTVDPVDVNKPVYLGEWQTKQLVKAGQTTKAVPFTIHLTGCTADSAKLTFTGTKDTTDSTLLAVDGKDENAASGVAIEILDSQHNRIPMGADTPSAVIDTNGNGTLDFWADYVSTGENNAKPGEANAATQFTLTYY